MAVTRGFEFGNAHEFRAGPVVKILGQGDIGDLAFGGATFTIHLPSPTSELPAPVRAGDVLQREASS